MRRSVLYILLSISQPPPPSNAPFFVAKICDKPTQPLSISGRLTSSKITYLDFLSTIVQPQLRPQSDWRHTLNIPFFLLLSTTAPLVARWPIATYAKGRHDHRAGLAGIRYQVDGDNRSFFSTAEIYQLRAWGQCGRVFESCATRSLRAAKVIFPYGDFLESIRGLKGKSNAKLWKNLEKRSCP